MNNLLIANLSAALLSLLFLGNAQAENSWASSNGKSCEAVCTAQDKSPVVSGLYKGGSAFNICRTDAGGEGKRAGYNLQPAWADKCFVGWGGQEKGYSAFDCLCQ